MSSFDPTLDPKPVVVRRLEVLTGVGGRRRWSADDKARIVEETLAPGATVSEVARRHDIRPQQLFGWRREMRIVDPGPAVSFVPALVEAVNSEKVERSRPRSARTGRGDIELEFQGVVVRVRRGAEAKTVAAVIKALKATR
ncbi:transposase [Bosea sp. CRIB-10]|uniref:IS66-like element accessory protein TnpA n=1 Tax=Bosea sp. CRIB-10 TaxID=378404 RepID=UPI0008F0891B|nr:transposase [Bosea sp. CRIB-10]SFD22347.1 transposase [Bosea sp. CRIB-10]